MQMLAKAVMVVSPFIGRNSNHWVGQMVEMVDAVATLF
jgi:hypothetical protein